MDSRNDSQFLWTLFTLLFCCAAGETEVSCVFNESCVLPCSFTKGTDAVIHWIKTPGDVPVHIYYHSQDQFKDQNQDFKDRTSLFVDQISEGNASLLLTGFRLQDQGIYKCFTSSAQSEGEESYIILKVKEPEVSCVFNESCVLPCSFTKGTDEEIKWLKTTEPFPVHIYYHSQDQLSNQNQDFKDRTSLFVDQISEGNASLLLTGVRVQDEGRYMCFIRTDKVEQSYINVRVKASVSSVNMEQVGDEVICRSEEIYPEPGVTWSGSDGTEEKTSVFKTEKGLYSISSSVRLSHKRPLEHSCNISTDHSWRSATYRLLHIQISFSGNETTVSCTDSKTTIKSLIWTFNHTQTILTQTGINTVYNETWRRFVKEVSESGLTLKNLSSDHQGVYSCVLSSDRETYISITLVTKEGTNPEVFVVVGVLLLVVILIILVLVLFLKRLKKQQRSTRSHNSDKDLGEALKTEELLTSPNIDLQQKENTEVNLKTENPHQQQQSPKRIQRGSEKSTTDEISVENDGDIRGDNVESNDAVKNNGPSDRKEELPTSNNNRLEENQVQDCDEE